MSTNKPGALIKPKRNEECLCGSKQQFGNCCAAFQTRDTLGKKYIEAIQNQKWTLALKYARADLTRYLIWYKSHTEPVLLSGRLLPEPLEFLFEVDTESLNELANNIIGIFLRTDQKSKIEPLINHLDSLILLPCWMSFKSDPVR